MSNLLIIIFIIALANALKEVLLMKRIILALIIFTIFILSSYSHAGFLANTEITSIKDPAFANQKISNVLIWVVGLDLNSQSKAEKIFTKRFTEKKINLSSISSLSVILPTRKYTDEELLRVIQESKADSILTIQLTDKYTEKTYVPESTNTTGTGALNGNQFHIDTNTYKSGGYYISKPRIKMELKLFNAVSGDTMWIADVLSMGNGFAGFEDLIKSVAKEVFKQLSKDGLFNSK